MRLVADIGGTNSRVALIDPKTDRPERIRSYRNAGHASIEEVIDLYLAEVARPPDQIVIAIAGPVADNVGRLTNLAWTVDGPALSRRFSGIPVRVINDLRALGYAALHLAADQVRPLCPSTAPRGTDRQALVVGIGTGFNVSPVIEDNGRITCPPVEAGHISLPSRVARAMDVAYPGSSSAFDTVEDLFSGRGRRRFLSVATGQQIDSATPYLARQGQPGNAIFDAALDTYARLIGECLLDLKLAYLPRDGLYLAGGVARSSLDHHRAALCLEVFTQPGQFLETPVPLWIITDDAAALAGCGAC